MKMTKYCSRTFLVYIVAFCLSAMASFSGEKRTFVLTEDLSIGTEDGDDNLIFANVAWIGLDASGNIYILDWAENISRVQVFDPQGKFMKSIILPKGQGPAEVLDSGAVAVGPTGTVFVLDRTGRKVILLDKNGSFLRHFKIDFESNDIGCLDADQLVILGLNQGKILHLYSIDGRRLASFGGPFEIPPNLSQYKDMPFLKLPNHFNSSSDGSIFVINPHRFEVSIYKDAKLTGKFEGQSGLFEPARVQTAEGGMSIFFPYLTVLKSGDRLYVTVRRRRMKKHEQNEMIVYENNRRVGSLSMPGMPRAIDGQGRLYCSEETDFPRLVRYVVREK